MKLLITGDLVINRSYNGEKQLDKNIINLFNKSDYNIINLEAPITNGESKIYKTGPNIKSNEEGTLDVIKSLNVNIVTLANNHVLDYGEQGVSDTLMFCNENKIKTVGAGKNLEEASKILYFETIEGKIAIINFAENEWSSASMDSAGANPMDIIDNTRQIDIAKDNADFVILIIHGGHEYYNLPSPRMQKQYRFYAEQGVDLIVGHHTHCISGYETWKGVPIYYSLGNFLFTHNSSLTDWYYGLILEVNINSGKIQTELHPVQQEKENFKLGLLNGEEYSLIMNRVNGYSKVIEDRNNLIGEWNKYILLKEKSYLNLWSPISFIKNKYLKIIIYKLGIKLTNKLGIALFLNLQRCEAHSDLSKEIMTKYLKE